MIRQPPRSTRTYTPFPYTTRFRSAMTINILSLDFHVGAMAQHALDHGGDLGGRAALELGIDACRASFDMPVDHDAPSTITRMPFRHQVAIPGSELCGI